MQLKMYKPSASQPHARARSMGIESERWSRFHRKGSGNMSNKLPLRQDGMPDLNNWQEYVSSCGCKTICDLQNAYSNCVSKHESILLEKAIYAKKDEIVSNFVKILFAEGLTTKEAISVLQITEDKIMDFKFNL